MSLYTLTLIFSPSSRLHDYLLKCCFTIHDAKGIIRPFLSLDYHSSARKLRLYNMSANFGVRRTSYIVGIAPLTVLCLVCAGGSADPKHAPIKRVGVGEAAQGQRSFGATQLAGDDRIRTASRHNCEPIHRLSCFHLKILYLLDIYVY